MCLSKRFFFKSCCSCTTSFNSHFNLADVAVEIFNDVFVGSPVKEAGRSVLPPNLRFSGVNRHRYHSSDDMSNQKQSRNLEWKKIGSSGKNITAKIGTCNQIPRIAHENLRYRLKNSTKFVFILNRK